MLSLRIRPKGGDLGTSKWWGGAMGLLVAMVGSGCVSIEPNLGYCSNVNGDEFCDQRNADQQLFCVLATSACIGEHLSPEQRNNAEFDGCVATQPPDDCYSPCGGQLSAQESGVVCGGGGRSSGSSTGEEASSGSTTGGRGSTTMMVGTADGPGSTTAVDRGSSGSTDTGGAASSSGTAGDSETGPVDPCAGEPCNEVQLAMFDCVVLGFDGGTVSCSQDCAAIVTSECFVCGDGVLERNRGEQCDGVDFGGVSCQTEGYDGGVLACTPECMVDESGCHDCDGMALDPGEVCDGVHTGGVTCATAGFIEGTVGCAANCSAFVFDDCSLCGNGVREASEVCDGLDFGAEDCATQVPGTVGQLSCDVDCDGIDSSNCCVAAGGACLVDGECCQPLTCELVGGGPMGAMSCQAGL
ncbi:MAG: hypothetical protein K0V04_37320 [Deltaproteobacteria bacterium]|nr:hypothetical protein [Deltaproteobacteria bacterium]